jgi:acetyl-CoA C-acetyltransferase
MGMLTKLRALNPDGVTTAGNASGVNDGAVALYIGSREAGEKAGLKPMAKIIASASAGVPPRIMGIGPVPASQKALERAGLTMDDMDVIEINEAFAAQACAVSQSLNFDPSKTNPNGGAVAMGHPVGATGAIITIKALYELNRTQGQHALVTMCIGGGQGIAAVFKSV